MRGGLVALVFLAVLAGCGSQPGNGNDLSGAGSAMTKAGSARMEMVIRFGKDEGISGEGTFDYVNDRGRMTLRPLGSHYKDSFPGEGLYIGKTSYSGWKLLGRTVWLKESESDYELRGAESFIPGPGGPRPDRVLRRLMSAGKKTEILGSRTIRGVKTRHYRVHVEGSKFEAQTDPTYDPVVEAWVDEDGLVHRLEIPSGRDGPVQIIDIFDYGVPVDIQAPAEDEIVTQSEFHKLMRADCKQRKEKGLGVDESECTRGDVVEAGPIPTLPITPMEPPE